MLRHYIKMAMRHLLKNKIQNLISVSYTHLTLPTNREV